MRQRLVMVSVLAGVIVTAAVLVLAQGDNLALNATPTASSSYPGYPVRQVNDGDMDTRWAAYEKADEWVQLEWDTSRYIMSCCVYQRRAKHDSIPDASIDYWNGAAWVEITRTTGIGDRWCPEWETVATTKLRLVSHGSARLYPSVWEFEAYEGEEPTPTPTETPTPTATPAPTETLAPTQTPTPQAVTPDVQEALPIAIAVLAVALVIFLLAAPVARKLRGP
jgi:hypothetical protein